MTLVASENLFMFLAQMLLTEPLVSQRSDNAVGVETPVWAENHLKVQSAVEKIKQSR